MGKIDNKTSKPFDFKEVVGFQKTSADIGGPAGIPREEPKAAPKKLTKEERAKAQLHALSEKTRVGADKELKKISDKIADDVMNSLDINPKKQDLVTIQKGETLSGLLGKDWKNLSAGIFDAKSTDRLSQSNPDYKLKTGQELWIPKDLAAKITERRQQQSLQKDTMEGQPTRAPDADVQFTEHGMAIAHANPQLQLQDFRKDWADQRNFNFPNRITTDSFSRTGEAGKRFDAAFDKLSGGNQAAVLDKDMTRDARKSFLQDSQSEFAKTFREVGKLDKQINFSSVPAANTQFNSAGRSEADYLLQLHDKLGKANISDEARTYLLRNQGFTDKNGRAVPVEAVDPKTITWAQLSESAKKMNEAPAATTQEPGTEPQTTRNAFVQEYTQYNQTGEDSEKITGTGIGGQGDWRAMGAQFAGLSPTDRVETFSQFMTEEAQENFAKYGFVADKVGAARKDFGASYLEMRKLQSEYLDIDTWSGKPKIGERDYMGKLYNSLKDANISPEEKGLLVQYALSNRYFNAIPVTDKLTWEGFKNATLGFQMLSQRQVKG